MKERKAFTTSFYSWYCRVQSSKWLTTWKDPYKSPSILLTGAEYHSQTALRLEKDILDGVLQAGFYWILLLSNYKKYLNNLGFVAWKKRRQKSSENFLETWIFMPFDTYQKSEVSFEVIFCDKNHGTYLCSFYGTSSKHSTELLIIPKVLKCEEILV